MINTFFYYKNNPNNYVRLHKGNCRFCNFGNGLQEIVLGHINGLWSNEFLTYSSAYNAALETARLMPRLNTIVKNCKKCNPQI